SWMLPLTILDELFPPTIMICEPRRNVPEPASEPTHALMSIRRASKEINAPWNGGAALRESAEKSTTAFAPLLSIMAPGGMVLVLATQSLRPKHWSDKSSTVRPGSGFGAGPPGLTSWKEIVPKLFRVAVAAELASRKMIWPLLLMVDAPALLFPRNTTLLLFVT